MGATVMNASKNSRRWQLHAQLSGIRQALEALEEQIAEVDDALLSLDEQEPPQIERAGRPPEPPTLSGTPLAIAAG
jgi:hypothetical protein